MPYFNEKIKRGIPYRINVDASGAGTVAITVLKINKRDRFAAAEQLFADADAAMTLTDAAGPKIGRIIVAVHPAGNATVSVEIIQGARAFSQACFGDTDIVFDTEP
jgi:hypothetical protein